MTDAPAAKHSAASARRRVPRWVWFVAACIALGAMTSVGVAWGIAWRCGPIAYGGTARSNLGESLITPQLFDYEQAPEMGFKSVDDLDPTKAPRSLRLIGSQDWLLAWSAYRSSRLGVAFNEFHSAGLPPEPRDLVWLKWFDGYSSDPISQRAIRRHIPLLDAPEARGIHFDVVIIGWPCLCLGYERAFTRRDAEYVRREFPNDWLGGEPGSSLDPFYGALKVGEHDGGYAWHLLPLSPLWPGLLANTAVYGGAWAVLIGAPILLRRYLRARRGGCPQCGYSREGLKVDAPCPECGRAA